MSLAAQLIMLIQNKRCRTSKSSTAYDVANVFKYVLSPALVCVCGEAYSSSFCARFYAVGSSGILFILVVKRQFLTFGFFYRFNVIRCFVGRNNTASKTFFYILTRCACGISAFSCHFFIRLNALRVILLRELCGSSFR